MSTSHSAHSLLAQVIEAHGGMDRWNRVQSIILRENFSGGLLSLKGYAGKYQPTFNINARQQECTVQNLGTTETGFKGRWAGDRTWLETADGSITESLMETRESFKGHQRSTPWNLLQLTYFAAYGHWNYLCTPFIFTWPGVKAHESEIHIEDGQRWRVLDITYPDDFVTHTRQQRFYFDEDTLLLRRLDYAPDVTGGVPVAHYCYDHKEFDGMIESIGRELSPDQAFGEWRQERLPLMTAPNSWLQILHLDHLVRESLPCRPTPPRHP